MTKQEIETPALLVNLDRMEANLERMAAFFRTTPAKLRPHFKNHKCPELAARQLDAGAIGVTCATLGEAECLVQHGVGSVLLANEIADPVKIRRFVELARQADVIVCVDNEKNVDELARAGRNRGTPVSVLVDVDVGLHRCGAPPGDPAVRLARSVVEKGLRLRGLMGYEGHLSRRLPGPEKEEAVAAAMRPLMETKARLEREGLPVEIVSGGATGTYSISGCYPGVTEIQAGSYLLMDTDYRKCCADFDLTLTMLATVISKAEGEHVVVDAGLKALSCERGVPTVKDLEGLTVRKLTAEHGIIDLHAPSAPVEVGDKIELWAPYSDATVNLNERMYGIRNGRVEEIFAVDGRGR
ncbi:MAG: DSD1 family PLP-dependent enzyme [Bryobacteraceae bacterium]|jgi:D-serine deaminase-like pyridoxal phosphate-dependent protein